MSSAGGSFGHASVQVGADWAVRCSAYPGQAPILTVDAGNTAISITVTARSAPGPHAVEFARELAAQAAQFAAECERLHAAHIAPDDTAAGQTAA
jgi:hypothetical protein